ncbi:MAG TPA: hypothetical protein VGP76_11565 [Planctomycetaceae bacterium]|jgi:hypothetical protein|nr:hypothetical protein [Planctomycetaceae bacterium]
MSGRRVASVLLGVFASLAVAAGDDGPLLTWEEQRYVETITAALPVECGKIVRKLGEHTKKSALDTKERKELDGELELLSNRLKDLKAGLVAPLLPDLSERRLSVGAVGRFCGSIRPTEVIGPEESVVRMRSVPRVHVRGSTYSSRATSVILAGVRIRPEELNSPVQQVIKDFIVTAERMHGGQTLFVIKPLDVDVPKLTALVHRKLQQR